MPTVSYVIANTADDVSYAAGFGLFDSSPGNGVSGAVFSVGFRFLAVAVPQGATINSATLTVVKDSGSSTAGSWGVIKGVNADTAPAWTTTDPSAASKTTQSVTIADGATQNYDVAAIVQAIVNRGGWVAGSALAFAGDPTGATGLMAWVDYSTSTTNCAQLSIDYTPSGPVTLNTLTLTASVLENANNGTVAGTVGGRTSGSTLSLVGSPPFAIDSATGNITKNGSLSYTSSPYSITVRETLAGATNTPNDTVLSVTVTQARPIEFIDKNTGTNTATMPVHQTGDLIRVYTFRDGSNTPPSLVAGYTSLSAPTGTQTCSHRIAEKVATSSSETVGTWTNATSVIVRIYRPAATYSFTAGNGAIAVGTGTGTTVTYPAVTLNNVSGTSWVDCAAGHRSVNTSLETPPTGTVFRAGVLDATDEAAAFDTNGGVTTWTSKAVSVGGTSSGWTAVSAELRVSGGGATAYTMTASPGSYSLSGQVTNLTSARRIIADAGSYALTGQDATLVYTAAGVIAYTITAEAGSYVLTGQVANLTSSRRMTADPGSYVLTGNAANLTSARRLTADPGSYTLTGQPANLTSARRILADAGSYILTGQAATLTYTPSAIAYSMTAAPGSYVLTGNATNFARGRVLIAASGSYTLSGQPANLTRGYVLSAQPGSYALTGQSVNLQASRRITAETGSYSLIGNPVNLVYGQPQPLFFIIG